VPTAARWEEMRNPNEWRRRLPVEAASGLNDGLGAVVKATFHIFLKCTRLDVDASGPFTSPVDSCEQSITLQARDPTITEDVPWNADGFKCVICLH